MVSYVFMYFKLANFRIKMMNCNLAPLPMFGLNHFRFSVDISSDHIATTLVRIEPFVAFNFFGSSAFDADKSRLTHRINRSIVHKKQNYNHKSQFTCSRLYICVFAQMTLLLLFHVLGITSYGKIPK